MAGGPRRARLGPARREDRGRVLRSPSERLHGGGQWSLTSTSIEDACQFAWSRLVRHAHRVEQDTALSWLATTAVREAIKLARRDQRELSLEAKLEETGELNVPATTPGPHEQAEWREQLELLRRLPARQQLFLWLHTAGLSYEEIAASPT